MSPAAEVELLSNLSRSITRNEKMSEQLTKMELTWHVKAAVDEERHNQLTRDLANMRDMFVTRSDALETRVKKLEEGDRAALEETKKEAKEEARYWGRWIVGAVLAVGLLIVGAILRGQAVITKHSSSTVHPATANAGLGEPTVCLP